jgi:hypothetical protein
MAILNIITLRFAKSNGLMIGTRLENVIKLDLNFDQYPTTNVCNLLSAVWAWSSLLYVLSQVVKFSSQF